MVLMFRYGLSIHDATMTNDDDGDGDDGLTAIRVAPPHGLNPSTTTSFIMNHAHSDPLSERLLEQINILIKINT